MGTSLKTPQTEGIPKFVTFSKAKVVIVESIN